MLMNVNVSLTLILLMYNWALIIIVLKLYKVQFIGRNKIFFKYNLKISKMSLD